MSLLVRPLLLKDLAAVIALAEALPEAPHWNREQYEPSVSTDGSSRLLRAGFIAESNGAFAGFAAVLLAADICELEMVAVVPAVRRQGVGLLLLNAIREWAVLHHAGRLELEVRESNATAIRLYERVGMRAEGRRKSYYSNPDEDALLMSISLTEK